MRKGLAIAFCFLVCLALTLLGCILQTPILTCSSALASAIMGAIVSIVVNAIDTHGQGLALWVQQFKFRKTNIRLSFSYLFRIPIDGKYLLVKGNRLKKQYQPIGGVYKYYKEAKPILESFNYRPDTKMGNYDETDDLRIYINGKHLLKYMDWFLSMKDREYDPYREFFEELINTRLIPEEKFKTIEYRKIGVHNKGVLYSKFMNCNEFVYADIFELKLSNEQEKIIRDAVVKNPDYLCLVSAEEMKSECYNGIEKNIGNNAIWLLGE